MCWGCPVLTSPILIKNDELCLIGSSVAHGATREAGLYLRDTRFLSTFDVRLAGQECTVLAVRQVTDQHVVMTLVNPQLDVSGETIGASEIAITMSITLGRALSVAIKVVAWRKSTAPVALEITAGADFRDMFEVRGFDAAERLALDANVDGSGGQSSARLMHPPPRWACAFRPTLPSRRWSRPFVRMTLAFPRRSW